MPRITLQPSGCTFAADEPQTILQAALAAGLRLPVSCRNGTCRTCRCRVLSGTAAHTIEWPGLLREELAEGWILPCVARAVDDLVLEAPSVRLASAQASPDSPP
jgi:ferredoxin